MPSYNAYTDVDPAPWNKMAIDRKKCPVEHVRNADGFSYFQVSSYDLVKRVHREHKSFLNSRGVIPRGAEPEDEQVLTFADPPKHTRQRRLIGKAFSAARVNEKMERIQQVADDLIDAIDARGANTFPLKRAFTRPLPAQMIAELLGVPAGDRDQFLRWAEIGESRVGFTDVRPEQVLAHKAFLAYSLDQLRQRRIAPKDDLLSKIINAEENGERLSETEAAAMVRLLLAAGVGTTAIGISNLLWSLENNPAEKAKLLADLDGLAASAVEEGFRFDCPVQGAFRGVANPLELDGVAMDDGDRIYMQMSSANHDDSIYDRADEFVVDRDWDALPRHFAFGFGIHFCIGADLARLETQIALKTLYKRLPGLRVRPGFVPEQIAGMVFRTWHEIEMVYDGPARPRLSAR
jgi:cytochrome P450